MLRPILSLLCIAIVLCLAEYSSFCRTASLMCSDSSKVWTLNRCVEYALENNVNIKRQELFADRKRIDLSLAQWSYAPSVSAGVSYTLSSGRVLDETTYSFIENETLGSSGVLLSCSFDLFNGFQKLHRLKYARIDLKTALAEIEVAKYDLKMNVIAYYLEILCAKENINAFNQLVRQLEMQEEKTAAKVSAGMVTEADLLQIRAQLYSAANDVFSAQSTYETAKIDLCQLLEINDYVNFEIASPENISIGYDLTGNVSEVVDSHPKVQSAELSVELAKWDLKIAKTHYCPSISLSAGYGSNHSDARQKVLQEQDGTLRYEAYPFFHQYADNASSYLSVSLNIPIFTGLSVRKDILRKQLAIKDSEYALVSAKKSVERSYAHAKIDAQAAWNKYQGTKEQVRYAEEVVRNLTIKYDAGAIGILSYITAVTELAKAKHSFNAAKYTYIMKIKLLELFCRLQPEADSHL